MKFKPVSGNFETLTCNIRVRDKAGNWSDNSTPNVRFLDQTLGLNVQSSADTLFVSGMNFRLSVDISCEYPKTMDRLIASTDSDFDSVSAMNFDTDTLNQVSFASSSVIDVTESGMWHLAAVDSAGNAGIDSVYIRLQTPPEIALTLFDRSEYQNQITSENGIPDVPDRIDSEFTDEKTVIALVEILGGEIDSIRFAVHPDSLQQQSFEYLNQNKKFIVSEHSFQTSALIKQYNLYVQVKNRSGKQFDTGNSIIYDVQPPVLHAFNGPKAVKLSDSYQFSFRAWDQSPGELAGLWIIEKLAFEMAQPDSIAHFIPIEETGYDFADSTGSYSIPLIQEQGAHLLSIYILDKADIDQNASIERIRTEIDHASDEYPVRVMVGPDEEEVFTNYPKSVQSGAGSNNVLLVFKRTL
ncbi:MAG: hypothetical protein U5R06_21895 [candidate division KSB1 bacterium]|nr:hypothetical protein [candidate division KSB1 bacterium]